MAGGEKKNKIKFSSMWKVIVLAFVVDFFLIDENKNFISSVLCKGFALEMFKSTDPFIYVVCLIQFICLLWSFLSVIIYEQN